MLNERAQRILAITQKDLKIAFRFPKNFIAVQLINPLRMLVVLWLVYQSFFVLKEGQTLGNWNRGNYIPTLLIGAIFYTCFGYAYYRFRVHFLNEKYWKTIQIFLTAPVSKLDFLIGSSLALMIELSPPILCYLTLFQVVYPVPVGSLLLIIGGLYLMLFGVLGISLMQGAFSISNENYLFVFDYFFAGLALFSCFYYTDMAVPQPVRFLTTLNPIYHAVEIARTSIFHHLSSTQIFFSLIYLLIFAAVLAFFGGRFFQRVVNEMGVRGF